MFWAWSKFLQRYLLVFAPSIHIPWFPHILLLKAEVSERIYASNYPVTTTNIGIWLKICKTQVIQAFVTGVNTRASLCVYRMAKRSQETNGTDTRFITISNQTRIKKDVTRIYISFLELQLTVCFVKKKNMPDSEEKRRSFVLYLSMFSIFLHI